MLKEFSIKFFDKNKSLLIICLIFCSTSFAQVKNQFEFLGGTTFSLLSDKNQNFLHIFKPSFLSGFNGCYSYKELNTFSYHYGVLYVLNLQNESFFFKTGLVFQNRNYYIKFYENQCLNTLPPNAEYGFLIHRQTNIEIPIYLTYSTKHFEGSVGLKSAVYWFTKRDKFDSQKVLLESQKSNGHFRNYGISQVFRPSIMLMYKINVFKKFGLGIYSTFESRDINYPLSSYFDWSFGLLFKMK